MSEGMIFYITLSLTVSYFYTANLKARTKNTESSSAQASTKESALFPEVFLAEKAKTAFIFLNFLQGFKNS